MANPVARRLLGVCPREDRKTPATIWEPPESLRQPLAGVLREQHEYLPEGFEKAVVLQVGDKTHSFLPRILPIRDSSGVTLGAAVLLEDITRFRLLDEVKSNLVATVSHELKTPLTSIRIVLHLLLEECVGPLVPKQIELLVDARDNAERLPIMINNLLDLAKLEQGRIRLRLQSVRPAALLQAAVESFRPRAEDQGVELVPGGCRTVGSRGGQRGPVPARPAQPAGQLAEAHAAGRTNHRPAAEAAGQRIVVSVTDTGSGIPPQHVPLVFEKYFACRATPPPSAAGWGWPSSARSSPPTAARSSAKAPPARRPSSA